MWKYWGVFWSLRAPLGCFRHNTLPTKGPTPVFVPGGVWNDSSDRTEVNKPKASSRFLCIYSEWSALPFSCSWLVTFDLLACVICSDELLLSPQTLKELLGHFFLATFISDLWSLAGGGVGGGAKEESLFVFIDPNLGENVTFLFPACFTS